MNCKKCGEPRTPERCKACNATYAKARRAAGDVRYFGRTYGLTADEYREMKARPCAVCGERGKVEIDHDHACCKNGCRKCVRGALCGRCNKLVGWIESNPDLVAPALDFLRKVKRK